jgi:hypothetical protein
VDLTRLLPLLVLGTTLGCVATSGQDWLSSPIDAAPPESIASATPVIDTPATRPRLRETVTLGESYVVATRDAYGSPPAGAAAVQVNVSTYVPVTNNYYGGYGGLGYVYANDTVGERPNAIHPSQPAPLQPGQSFAPPPSYGPSFPFRSAPASPWAR